MATSNIRVKLHDLFSKYYLHGIIILVLLGIIIRTFQQLSQTFYQQDEWLGVGQLMAIGWESVIKGNNILQLLFADGRPLTRVFGVLFFKIFAFQSYPLAIYSIIFHFLNTLLVYFIINKLLKNKFFSFLGAAYFAVADVAHQSVSWFGASFGEQPASLFIFLSMLLFILFMENKRKVYLYSSFISAIVSLYFKESGIFLIPLYIVLPFILEKKYPIKKLIYSYTPLIAFMFLFIGFRFVEMIFSPVAYQPDVYVTSSSSHIVVTMIIRTILYPLTGFSLSFIPYPTSTFLGDWLWKLYYPYITQRPDLVFQTVVLDLIAVIFSSCLLAGCFIMAKKKEFTRPILFALIFFFLSILPYIAISKEYAYLEPRYYYVSLLANCTILSVFFSYIYQLLKGKWRFIFIILLGLYGVYLRYNINIVRHDIAMQVNIAKERKAFIHQLYSYLPSLTSNTNIFYFTGDKPWLVDGNYTPFQNGFGYTLMVLYYPSSKVPQSLLPTQYLFALGEEGAKTIDGKTFGYFNNYSNLHKYIKEKHVAPSSVESFYYESNSRKLYNITDKVRQQLSQDL